MTEPEQSPDPNQPPGEEPKGGLGILFLAAALALAVLLTIIALIAFALMRQGALERGASGLRFARGGDLAPISSEPRAGRPAGTMCL